MKKILIAIIIFITGLLFCSCDEITNIGKVDKDPLFPLIPPGHVTTIVKPDSTYWLIVEVYSDIRSKNDFKGTNWGRNIKFIKNNIEIDTAGDNPIISLDIEIESTIPDKALPDRKDRVNSFRLKLDSLDIKGIFQNELDYKITDLLGLYVKTIKDQKTYYLNQDELLLDWRIFESMPGVITGVFNVYMGKTTSFETTHFGITFDFYYPKKKK